MDAVEIPAATFTMGSDRHYPDEAPAREDRGHWVGRRPTRLQIRTGFTGPSSKMSGSAT